jgi:hypothetical protein
VLKTQAAVNVVLGEVAVCSGIRTKPLQALCGKNVNYGLERCFLTFVSWRNSENNFLTPFGENFSRPEKADTGERNSITAKLWSRKFICKKIRSISGDVQDVSQYFRISRFLYIQGFLAEPVTMFRPTLVGKHRYRRLRKFRN